MDCGLGIDIDDVDMGWDRRRQRGSVWLGTAASLLSLSDFLFSHSDFVSQIGVLV